MAMKVFWKVYFWLVALLWVISITDITWQVLSLRDAINIPLSWIALVGVFGYAYRRKLISQNFWKFCFFLIVGWDVLYFSALTEFTKGQMGILLVLGLPQYIALYLYGLRSTPLWSGEDIEKHMTRSTPSFQKMGNGIVAAGIILTLFLAMPFIFITLGGGTGRFSRTMFYFSKMTMGGLFLSAISLVWLGFAMINRAKSCIMGGKIISVGLTASSLSCVMWYLYTTRWYLEVEAFFFYVPFIYGIFLIAYFFHPQINESFFQAVASEVSAHSGPDVGVNRRLAAANAVLMVGASLWLLTSFFPVHRYLSEWANQPDAGKQALAGHTESVTGVAFSPDGLLLATASRDGTVKLWDLATGEVEATLGGDLDGVWAVAFSPDGRLLAVSAGKTVKLWDVVTGGERVTLHSDGHAVAFSPDGRLLATDDGKTVKLLDVETGGVRAALAGHTSWIGSVAFSPDGRLLATAGGDRNVKLWDLATGQLRADLQPHVNVVRSVAFSSDGRLLATGGGGGRGGGTVEVWVVQTGKLWPTLEPHAEMSLTIAFSPDGRLLAAGGGEGIVTLWDVATGKIRGNRKLSEGGILSIAFSPDGRTLATGSSDKTAKLWDVAKWGAD